MSLGWIGTVREVRQYLATVRADRAEDGAYLLTGPEGPVVGVGQTGEGAEVVIPGTVEYLVDGSPCNLASGLHSTSYGLRVRVY